MVFQSVIQKFIQNLTLGIQNNLISDCFGLEYALRSFGVRSEVVWSTLTERSHNGLTTEEERTYSEGTPKD